MAGLPAGKVFKLPPNRSSRTNGVRVLVSRLLGVVNGLRKPFGRYIFVGSVGI